MAAVRSDKSGSVGDLGTQKCGEHSPAGGTVSGGHAAHPLQLGWSLHCGAGERVVTVCVAVPGISQEVGGGAGGAWESQGPDVIVSAGLFPFWASVYSFAKGALGFDCPSGSEALSFS